MRQHAMYCSKCGTFFIAENCRGRVLAHWRCPNCGKQWCEQVDMNSDRGFCILANPQAYPKAIEYVFGRTYADKVEVVP